MKILGIDPGTATTGYCLIDYKDGEKPVILEASTFDTSPDFSIADRLLYLHKLIDEKIAETKPECLVIEKLFFNTNIKTAIAVGQARGVLLMAAAKHKLDIFEYTALQAKLVVTGYGRSSKKEVQEAVKNYFNLEKIIKPDDASDAVAISLCHIHKELIK
ncbi:MAG: crossover junction endodeoxyribonuclease RuvC [Proteobacteria bacterium]|nr:crossover junction endodeoxyribonuclease RuvC [Pseudomonadota bacterium]